jgi:hypothetical protein
VGRLQRSGGKVVVNQINPRDPLPWESREASAAINQL